MKITYLLSVEKDTDLTTCAEFLNMGFLQGCTNEKPPFPYHATVKPELLVINADFTIPEDYLVCNLYNMIQNWINPEDHILVHQGFLLPQFKSCESDIKNFRYNTQTVSDAGIEDGDVIHSNRNYKTWTLGNIKLGTIYQTGAKYFVRPDLGIIEFPTNFVDKETGSLREQWNPTFRNIKFLFQSCLRRNELKIVAQLQPLIDVLEEL